MAIERTLSIIKPDAEGFYDIHRGRPFFNDLVKFMTSGAVMVQILEGEDAIKGIEV